MKKLLFLFAVLTIACSLWASNVITYMSTAKLPEPTSSSPSGLHTEAFNVSITSHTFSNGIGTITFSGEVTSIGYGAFYNCSGLTSVTIPESVTSIGDIAFNGCSGLTSITIPNSVTSIGYGAFDNCSGLTSVTIPNSVTSIGESAFRGCSSLTSIAIPESVTSIGERAFQNCSGLTSITIPNSVKSIRDQTFYGCSGLTSITIPNSVKSISSNAFDDCTSLKTVVWNAKNCQSPTKSSDAPFYNVRENIESFGFGNEVQSIPSDLCYGMSRLSSITIPNSVTSIGVAAFSHCSGLTSVTIPKFVTSIGVAAFSYCSGLTSITIPNSVKSIGESAFDNCSGLTSVTIPNSVTSIGNYTFHNCSGLTSVTIGNSVTSIGSYAFYKCSGLTSVTIGNSVTSIGSYAFDNCSGLTSVTIPNSVTSIGNYAFRGCSSLTSVTIPNSVTSIGERAFCDCSSLTSVNIGNSVTSIGNYTFYNCSGLTSITIGNSVTSIRNAFDDCTSLKTVVWNAKNYPSPSNYSYAPFYNFRENIESFVFGDEVESIPSYLCYGMKKITSVTIPNSVTSIGDWAFYGCSGLTSVVWNAANCSVSWSYNNAPFYNIRVNIESFVFGDEVKSIPSYLCYGMSKLTSITIPNSVRSLGDQTFSGCSGLTSVVWNVRDYLLGSAASDAPFYSIRKNIESFVFGDEVQSIPSYLCYGMSKLTSITIPNSVTSIRSYAFYKCSGLTSVTIGNSVKYIGDYAFQDCSGLTSITIPNSVTSIGNYAFSYCYGLTFIMCEAMTPPACGRWCFSSAIPVYVPCESVEAYKAAAVWRDFTNIQCFAVELGDVVTNVVVTPSENSANIVWPKDDAASTYTIVITKDGTTICTLTFNGNGQQTNIAFAPSRDGESPARVAESINGSWSFTVTSLTPATKYDYSVTTKNAAQSVLKTYTGSFTTTGRTPIDNISAEAQVEKFLRDGQILIQRNNTTYNLRGQQVM